MNEQTFTAAWESRLEEEKNKKRPSSLTWLCNETATHCHEKPFFRQGRKHSSPSPAAHLQPPTHWMLTDWTDPSCSRLKDSFRGENKVNTVTFNTPDKKNPKATSISPRHNHIHRCYKGIGLKKKVCKRLGTPQEVLFLFLPVPCSVNWFLSSKGNTAIRFPRLWNGWEVLWMAERTCQRLFW